MSHENDQGCDYRSCVDFSEFPIRSVGAYLSYKYIWVSFLHQTRGRISRRPLGFTRLSYSYAILARCCPRPTKTTRTQLMGGGGRTIAFLTRKSTLADTVRMYSNATLFAFEDILKIRHCCPSTPLHLNRRVYRDFEISMYWLWICKGKCRGKKFNIRDLRRFSNFRRNGNLMTKIGNNSKEIVRPLKELAITWLPRLFLGVFKEYIIRIRRKKVMKIKILRCIGIVKLLLLMTTTVLITTMIMMVVAVGFIRIEKKQRKYISRFNNSVGKSYLQKNKTHVSTNISAILVHFLCNYPFSFIPVVIKSTRHLLFFQKLKAKLTTRKFSFIASEDCTKYVLF